MNEYETEDTFQLSERIQLTPGKPVRITGRRGLFRFVRLERRVGNEEWTAVVIGPIGGAEGERIVAASLLKSAGRTPESAVAPSAEARAITIASQARRTPRR